MPALEVHLGRLQRFVDCLAYATAMHASTIVTHVVVELLLDAEERGALAAAEVARAMRARDTEDSMMIVMVIVMVIVMMGASAPRVLH